MDRTISLFAEVPSARRGPSAFLVSALVHLALICVCYVYMKETVHVADRLMSRYTVRLINMRQPPPVTRAGGSSGGNPDISAPMMRAVNTGGQPSTPMVQAARPVRAVQTLVQPDLPPDLLAKEVPLPQILIWTAGHTVVANITPPRPQIANTPVLHASLETPNEQLKIAEVKISASAFDASTLTLPPSTTAPVVVHRLSLPAQMPSTTSTAVGLATPARVISLSDIRLDHGTIALPALNAAGTPDGSEDPNAAQALAGHTGNSTGSQGASGAGSDNGDHGSDRMAGGGNQAASAGTGGQDGATQGSGHGVQGNGANDGSSTGGGSADGPVVTELRQPIDGQFNVVVVGSSIAEKYPETMQLWAGRLAYTVYLHVGLSKNWILQYAVTRDAASVDGGSGQPNAPWPYLMELPHLAPGDVNSDALMVHGRLNASGHFEALKVLFPADFSQAQFVLTALEKWRFRPARMNGQLIAVEVLLIIPEEED
ncbi:MAG TPA: hypothetical protein VGM02_04515 [Acidobacteriaceae bacterium]|jgi:hypothetical protein